MSGRAAALTLLHERAASIPERIRMLGDGAPPALHPDGFRAVRTTGVGSSGAHARALAEWLSVLGVDAGFVPPGAFPAEHDAPHEGDLLVGFSQGLSPNARLALGRPAAWRQVLVVTSTLPSSDDARGRFARELEDAGLSLLDSGAPDEYGTLVRLVGPATTFWTAWQIARAFGAEVGPSASEVAQATEQAAKRARDLATPLAAELGRLPVVFVASGVSGQAADNVRLKWTEALLRDVAPVGDLLDFAHGPFQSLFEREAIVISLSRDDDPTACERLAELEQMLVPERHHHLALKANLNHPLTLIEFEAATNELVLAALDNLEADPADWPGRGHDAALYELGTGTHVHPAQSTGRRLEAATWPEIKAALDEGQRTAILPLGSTEQHGPGLPFATDSWIADAVGQRLAATLPDAVRIPVLTLGAASEHLAFPGTLSLQPGTLTAVLADIAASLAEHGFERILCFSAHGGNLGSLRAADEQLRRAAAPAQWSAFTDHTRLNEALFGVSKQAGIDAAEAGQHAGELEASILDAIRPGALRRQALEAGRVDAEASGQDLFYPSLRDNARNGVVGDPRAPSRERGERYLAVWVEVLLGAFAEAR
jgi:creatinine amidohydrolase